MARRRDRTPGAQQHAEGQHGKATHRRFVEQLHEGSREAKRTESPEVAGHHRLHQDRQQHDEAEKNAEKVEAMREIQRGRVDEAVIAHARAPEPDGA
jgi:hypothetical protein